MAPTCGTAVDDPSKQATSPDAAEYNVRHEVQLGLYFLDHRSMAVPKDLIIVGGNEDPACICEDLVYTFDVNTRDTHALGLAETVALAFSSTLE